MTNEYLAIKIYLNQILPLQGEISNLKQQIWRIDSLEQQISSFDSLRWSIKSSIPYRICRKIYRIFKNK